MLEAARQAGVGLSAVCGGAGTCGTCRVRVVAGEVSSPTEAEAEAVVQGLRLACQARVLGDVRVDVPPDSITALQRVQVEGHERPIELDPAVRAFDVTLEPASLSDLRADATRLEDALGQQHDVPRVQHAGEAAAQSPGVGRFGTADQQHHSKSSSCSVAGSARATASSSAPLTSAKSARICSIERSPPRSTAAGWKVGTR